MSANLCAASVVVAAQNQVSCDLQGETAILGLTKGIYYGLDSIGSRVWTMLQQPQSVQALCDNLLLEYEVEPERCREDVLSLLEHLRAEGLVEVRGA